MARATAQWEALTARGLEHHTRTSDKRGFCGPTQGIRGAGAEEVLRGSPSVLWKAPQLIPGSILAEILCSHGRPAHHPGPTPASARGVPRVPRGSPGENGYDATLVS